jgi:hypothetical protein
VRASERPLLFVAALLGAAALAAACSASASPAASPPLSGVFLATQGEATVSASYRDGQNSGRQWASALKQRPRTIRARAEQGVLHLVVPLVGEVREFADVAGRRCLRTYDAAVVKLRIELTVAPKREGLVQVTATARVRRTTPLAVKLAKACPGSPLAGLLAGANGTAPWGETTLPSRLFRQERVPISIGIGSSQAAADLGAGTRGQRSVSFSIFVGKP